MENHYLVGDIGGQLGIFNEVLEQTHNTPAIQVGDMTRLRPI